MTQIRQRRSQGSRANKSGQVAENIIASILDDHGVEYVRQQPIGMSIYGHPLRVDFYLPTEELIIESKWQGIGGTADEKLPYLVMNIRECYPYPCILVLRGDGWKKGAIQWVHDAVDGHSLVAVLSADEFQQWCNRRF